MAFPRSQHWKASPMSGQTLEETTLSKMQLGKKDLWDKAGKKL